MVCALILAAIAAIAPHRPRTLPIHARPLRQAHPAIATAGDAPRLPSGYRSVRISLRWQAPEH